MEYNLQIIMYICLQILFFMLANSVDILANSVDPDEMPHSVAFHQGLHCLPKYLFMGFPVCKGLNYT